MNEGQIILQQLGGQRFIVMTGARQFLWDATTRTLTFRLPGQPNYQKRRINFCRIRLNGSDLYDLEFLWLQRRKLAVQETITSVSQATDIYNEDLPAVFTKHTGLHTRL